ncbi:MAG TPA: hypothetical protein VJ652_05260 [Noviherbaspirillum sp.]|nr:hypothetical protein [Noviherbaspirillum sp.]
MVLQSSRQLQRITNFQVGYGDHAACPDAPVFMLPCGGWHDILVGDGFEHCAQHDEWQRGGQPDKSHERTKAGPGETANGRAENGGTGRAAGEVPATQDNRLQFAPRTGIQA